MIKNTMWKNAINKIIALVFTTKRANDQQDWEDSLDAESLRRFMALDKPRIVLSFEAKLLRYFLIFIILALQYPLWFGKGGWTRVWDYQQVIEREKENTRMRQVRNSGMEEEITNMRDGRFDAIEERARFDLLMIKPGEIFIATPEKKINN